jgi:hypothetical protein
LVGKPPSLRVSLQPPESKAPAVASRGSEGHLNGGVRGASRYPLGQRALPIQRSFSECRTGRGERQARHSGTVNGRASGGLPLEAKIAASMRSAHNPYGRHDDDCWLTPMLTRPSYGQGPWQPGRGDGTGTVTSHH